jgi:hypothetical protein
VYEFVAIEQLLQLKQAFGMAVIDEISLNL